MDPLLKKFGAMATILQKELRYFNFENQNLDLRAKNKEQKESKIESVAAEPEKQFDGMVYRRCPPLQKIKIKNNAPIQTCHLYKSS